MARTTTFTPIVVVGQTASAVTSPIDLGIDQSAELILDVTAVSGTARTLLVSIETSADGALAWRTVGNFAQKTMVSWESLPFTGCSRYIRIRSAVGGTAPSFSYSITGVTVLVYASVDDLYRFGLPVQALTDVPAWTVSAALRAATDFVNGYLAKAYTLPLISWGDDIRRAVAVIAAYDLITTRGVNADDGADVWIRQRYLDLVGKDGWLVSLANGTVTPPGTVDGTPTTTAWSPEVFSNEPREW